MKTIMVQSPSYYLLTHPSLDAAAGAAFSVEEPRLDSVAPPASTQGVLAAFCTDPSLVQVAPPTSTAAAL